jgi:predicted SAM-dependent methyltransferase
VAILKGLYIQYGCGLCAPEGWLNFDASARLRLERMLVVRTLIRRTAGLQFPLNVLRGDIVNGLPVPDRSAVAVYSSHCLEHLARNDVPTALSNTFRMLSDGGVFRLIVPDLQWRATHYLAAIETSLMPADQFLDACHLRERVGQKTWREFIIERYKRSHHLWMYDFPTLKHLLEQAGFCHVRRCEFGDSTDPMFASVEDKNRFVDNGQHELAIEAFKHGGSHLNRA